MNYCPGCGEEDPSLMLLYCEACDWEDGDPETYCDTCGGKFYEEDRCDCNLAEEDDDMGP